MMEEQKVESAVIPQVVVYNPSEIFGIYSDYLARQGGKIVCVRGVFCPGAGKSYNGFYYDTISDQSSGQELSIKIPENLRDMLTEGNLVDLAGIVERKLNKNGFIQLTLAVTRAGVVQEQTLSEDDMKRIELRNRKTASGFRNVDLVLESILMAGERPKVALVFAESSITDSDFRAGQEAASSQIDFSEYRVNFANSSEMSSLLQSIDTGEFNAISIIRGGGSGIEHLDDIKILETVVEMQTPIICAVGHVDEKIFIKYISDKVAPTPNGLGAYFKDIVEIVSQKRNNSRAALTKQIENQFKAQIETARKQNAELQGKIDKLTKNAEESQKLHKVQIDAAIKQNADLQKKIDEMNKGAAEGRKATDDQMGKLNSQLIQLQKTNKDQAEMFSRQLKSMQDGNSQLQQSITKLNEKNSDYSRKLAESEARCRQLQSTLDSTSDSSRIWYIIAIIVIAGIILIASLAG